MKKKIIICFKLSLLKFEYALEFVKYFFIYFDIQISETNFSKEIYLNFQSMTFVERLRSML